MPKNSPVARGLSSKVKVTATAAIIAILAASFAVYFIFQSQYEQQIRDTIFEKEEQRQVQLARATSQNIGSDLDSMMNRLYALSLSQPIQSGDFSSADTERILKQAYESVNAFSSTDGVYILDQNNKVVNYVNPSIPKPGFIGDDSSKLPVVLEYTSSLPNPYFSNGYNSVADGILKISLYHPIYNLDTGKYLGAVTMSLPVRGFLQQYGNLDDVNQQYINVLDRNATFLTAPVKTSIGKNFFSSDLSRGTTSEATEFYRTVLSGREQTALFSFSNFGSRLATGEPVIVGGKPQYFVFVINPTASIYSQIDSIINSQRTGFYILQGAIAAAIAIALFFLLRWSGTIERAVRQRTTELREANDRLIDASNELREANDQLKVQDQLQREFINVAAHELRTPVQPIMGVVELAESDVRSSNVNSQDGKGEVRLSRDEFDMIARNTKRLERLSSDILQVSRIEANTLKLDKEQFDLNQKIINVIREIDASHLGSSEKSGVKIEFNPKTDPIIVDIDRSKIFEVLSNLLRNAKKFTKEGSISITSEVVKDPGSGDHAMVTVKDTGSGIDAEVMPKLFQKFVTKSEQGTGLGLFISKSIIEAHGGRIWAENNKNGEGAVFYFTLPLSSPQVERSSPPTIRNVDGN